jgi:hypothetical protein
MTKKHAEKLERLAGNLRFILDLVDTMTDKRVSEAARMEAATDLAERESLNAVVGEAREIFRSIANAKADGVTLQD